MKEADVKKSKRCRPKTDNTNAQQSPWLFKPGQSGNPAGRPKGSRNKLAEDFLSDRMQRQMETELVRRASENRIDSYYPNEGP